MIQMKVNTFEEIVDILQKNVIDNRDLLSDLCEANVKRGETDSNKINYIKMRGMYQDMLQEMIEENELTVLAAFWRIPHTLLTTFPATYGLWLAKLGIIANADDLEDYPTYSSIAEDMMKDLATKDSALGDDEYDILRI